MCKDEKSGEERRRIEVGAVDADLCFAAKDNTARKQRRQDQSTEWTLLSFFHLYLFLNSSTLMLSIKIRTAKEVLLTFYVFISSFRSVIFLRCQ